MKKVILFFSLFISLVCNSQVKLQIDKNDSQYCEVKKINDSISKIKIELDTITKYKIDKIVEDVNFYIIYAKGKAKDGNEYQYRIKSDKSDCAESSNLIKEGGIYQLDLRDYSNQNQRLHFIPGVALNLITHMGFGYFDTIVHIDEKMTKDEFNIALNLKGLCLMKE
jgi:hypothetical protein